ncbi:MAG: epoxyqueuosine reductase [Coriobacteriales bacterium]|jgi:epoxyqueuosine reductase
MLKERIRKRAEELGFCKVGFTTPDDLPRVSEEAQRRDYPGFFQDMIERGSHPRDLMSRARSIIVLAYDYSELRYPEKLLPHVARTYLSHSYLPLEGTPARNRLDAFEAFLRDEGIGFEPDRNILMMRPAGLRAGVISFGRNNFAYVDGVGSFVILYGYLVDVELAPDEPSPDCTCPPGCRACIDACPTSALAREFDLELEKCILWDNAIRYNRGPDRDVPVGHREAIGVRIHGCDACQEACPRNQRALRNGSIADPVLERIAEEFSLENLLHMPEGFFERCVLPIMYNYVRDPVAYQRNAAVAMGNSGDPRYIPELEAELDNPSEIVRSHVRWALEKLRA